MQAVTYLKGDATSPQAEGVKIIAHICNDIGGWGKGFVLAISKKWAEPEKKYRQWHNHQSENDFELGNIQVVQVEDEIYVGNMIAQQGVKRRGNDVPIRYEALRQALEKLSSEAKSRQASVHMPRIGCGLAGGKWERVEPIILETLIQNDIDTFVYDFE